MQIRPITSLLFVACLLLTGQAFSQESDATPEPSSGQEDFITFYDVRMAEYRSQREERTLADYQIVYLGDLETTYEGNFFSGENIRAHFPDISVLTSADEFNAWSSDGEPNAIVIHASALSWLNVEWVQASYLYGTAVGTIGMSYALHNHLTGDNCTFPVIFEDSVVDNLSEVRPVNSSTMFISAWVLDDHLLTTNERELLYATGLSECRLPKLAREVAIGLNSSYNIFDLDLNHLEQFQAILVSYAGTRDDVIAEGVFADEIQATWHDYQAQRDQ